MARSKRTLRVALTPAALAQILPARFWEPELSDDLLGSLRVYLDDLTAWVVEQGITANPRAMALQIMSELGTSPAEWYRRAMETP